MPYSINKSIRFIIFNTIFLFILFTFRTFVKNERNMKTNLTIDNFNVRRKDFKDAISFKFDNRRITLVDRPNDKGFVLEFRCIDKEKRVKALHDTKLNMVITQLAISKEASELLMYGLAERLGFKIVKK